MIDIKKIRKEKPMGELLKFGVINIDKPSGPTSFFVSHYIAKQLKLNKTSHMGTLDPMVSGVLPVLLGRACRLSNYFMHRNKTYVGIMRIHADIEDKKLNEVISKFIGKIMQLPPVRSRVKREIREREVISFDILERDGQDILFKTEVQAGTYIRTICNDMGKEIGGAHMLELRRTQAGLFSEESKEFPLVNLYDFDKAVEAYNNGNDKLLREMIVPAEIISELLPVVQVKPVAVKQLHTGKPLMKNDIKDKLEFEINTKISVFLGEQFVGVYTIVNEGDIIGKADFVFN